MKTQLEIFHEIEKLAVNEPINLLEPLFSQQHHLSDNSDSLDRQQRWPLSCPVVRPGSGQRGEARRGEVR